MSDNDMIRRGDVKAKKVYCDERHEYVVPVAKIDWLIPAVPQEMSAREFAKAFRRMCDSYDVNGHNSCEGCEVWRENICCLCDLPDIIPIVEKWAREHPEERSGE